MNTSRIATVLTVLVLAATATSNVALAQGPRFPLKAYKNTKLGNSREVAGDVTIGSDGILSAKIRVETREALRGFTGSLCVAIFDPQGNLLWYGMSQGYGVDGEAVPGAPSKRIEFWSARLPNEVMGRIGYVSVHGTHNPKGFVTTLEGTIRQGRKAIEVVQREGATIVRAW